MANLKNYLGLVASYFRLNLRAQMEYRHAFIAQLTAMFINNCFWLAFWSIFFSRFHVLRGWEIKDVITLWAIAASGFGLAHVVCGNAMFLPRLIAQGQLDAWMLYPRILLSHFVLGKMSATACGDALFGVFVYLVFVHPDPAHFALFTPLVISAAVLLGSFSILSGSLGFFLGNSETLSEQWRDGLIVFSTYPSVLFEGKAKLILFTIIPAGFITYFPIKALQELSLLNALYALLGSLAVLSIAIAVFYMGLKRYESGNLMEMRG